MTTPMSRNEEEDIREMLSSARVIAVIGISDRPERSSYGVAEYLKSFYEVIPINPRLESWQGLKCYPDLAAVPAAVKIDIVNVFRRSEEVGPVVAAAIQRGAPYIWMQQGVVNEAAAQSARAAGIKVVMDACLAVAHSVYRRGG